MIKALQQFGGTLPRCLTVAVVLSSALVSSARPQTTSSPADGEAQAVASNQAVSLDREELDRQEPVQHEKAPGETDTHEEAAGREARADAPAVSRHVSRPVTPDIVPPRADGQPAPWYRTGIGALGIVLAVIGGGYMILRRCVPATRIAGTEGMRVVGKTALSPKHSLALIQIGRRFVVVGVSGDRLQNLCEVVDPAEVAELAARTGSRLQTGSARFDDALFREAAEFAPAVGYAEDADKDSPKKAAPGRREIGAASSSSVSELLSRLRVMQSR